MAKPKKEESTEPASTEEALAAAAEAAPVPAEAPKELPEHLKPQPIHKYRVEVSHPDGKRLSINGHVVLFRDGQIIQDDHYGTRGIEQLKQSGLKLVPLE